MTDTNHVPEQPQGQYYTQEIVEVVDNTRQRRLLAVILVLLMLALAAIGWFLFRSFTPAGAPKEADIPEGISWVRSIYAWGKTPGELINNPVDVAIGPSGTIWTISDKLTLVGFNPDGTPYRVVKFKRGGAEGMVNSIEGIDVADNGEIYAADYGNNKVVVLNDAGEIQREFGVQLPVDVAVNGERVAIAAASGVAITDPQGKLIAKWGSRGNGKDQVDIPHGIAWGGDGNIYLSDTDNRRVKAYSPDGRLLWIYPKNRETAERAGLGTSKTKNPSGLQLPAGMTTDASGRVVLVDPFEFKVIPVDAAKKGIAAGWGDFGRKDGSFAYPTGIDYDAARDWYVVADTANNRLQIIQLPGSGGNGIAASLRRLFDGPVWLCAIPLLLLLVAVVISVRRRREKHRALEAPAAA